MALHLGPDLVYTIYSHKWVQRILGIQHLWLLDVMYAHPSLLECRLTHYRRPEHSGILWVISLLEDHTRHRGLETRWDGLHYGAHLTRQLTWNSLTCDTLGYSQLWGNRRSYDSSERLLATRCCGAFLTRVMVCWTYELFRHLGNIM